MSTAGPQPFGSIWPHPSKHHPKRPKAQRAIQLHLTRMLVEDARRRRPPPITLPGQSAINGPVDPPPPVAPAPESEQWPGGWKELYVAPRATAGEHSRSKPNDGNGPIAVASC